MARIVEGDAGKAICKEAERILPVAVVMGTRGRSLLQRFSLSLSLSLSLSPFTVCVRSKTYLIVGFLYSVLQGSVSEHVFHNCTAAPVIIVPGIGIILNLLNP